MRETEDKQNSSRRRSRNNNSNTRLTRCSSGKIASSTLKGKGRQSVSSDSGVMSDESQAHSPTVLLLDGTTVRKDTLTSTNGAPHLSAVTSMPQLHRPAPSYPEQQQPQLPNRSNLLATMALSSLMTPPASHVPVSEGMFGNYSDFASSILMSSALLSRATNNNHNHIQVSTPPDEQPMMLINEPNQFDNLQRLQLLNSSLYQNSAIVQQAINQAHLFEQQQSQMQSTNLLINQLLTLKAQLAKPATSFFMPQPEQPPVVQQPVQNGLQQQLLHLLSQQLLQSNNTNGTATSAENATDSEPSDPTTSKGEDLDLVV